MIVGGYSVTHHGFPRYTGDFDVAYKNIDQTMYDKLKVNFIGYQDLIINKKASNRLQDQRDVIELEKVKAREKKEARPFKRWKINIIFADLR